MKIEKKRELTYSRLMSVSPKLAKNTLYYTGASVGVKVISFIYFTVIAGAIGTEGTGSYFLALAVTGVFAAVADFGLSSVLVREIAKKKEDAISWVRNVLGIKFVSVPLAATLAVIAPHILGYSAATTELVYIAIIIMVADSITNVLFGVMRGLQNLAYESQGIFIGQTITAIIGGLLIGYDAVTLPRLIFALLAGSVWNVGYSAFHIVRQLGFRALVPSFSLKWVPIKMSLAFFLAAIFVKVYSYVDSIILSKVVGEAAVGAYAVAYKLTYAFQFVPLTFIAALYPTMSAISGDKTALKKTLLDAFWYLALIGFPIVFGIWAIAPEIIHAFYGDAFSGSVLPLQVLIFVLIPIFLDFPVGSLLNATNRQYIKTSIMGGAMVVNLIANLILIPLYGVVGASIAALISFTGLFVSGWFFARHAVAVHMMEVVRRVGGILLSAILMAGAVLLVKPFMHFALAIPLGAIVYLTAIIATKSFTLEHASAFKRLLFKRADYAEKDLTPDA